MRTIAAAFVGLVLLAPSASEAAPKRPQPGAKTTPTPSRAFYVVESGLESWTIIDPRQIEVLGGGAVTRVWSIRVARNIMATPPAQPGYVRTLTDYDCARREFRWREFTAFSRSGDQLISRQNPAYGWEDALKAPDTAAAFQVVCGQNGGRGVVVAESAAKLVILLMGSWDKPLAQPTPAAQPATRPAKPGSAPRVRQLGVGELWP